jgi:uncharacterized repeat protein (TIGR03803 family)
MKSYAITTIVPFLTQNLPDGGLLGTGGSNAAVSYLVTCSLNGVVTPFYTFPAGETLPTNVILASDGNYYGIYYLQDASGYVYRVTPSGVLTNLYGFPAGTFNFGPRWSPLLQAADGNLYGVTANGGANNTGTIYKLSLGGQYTLLYTFPKGNTYNPSALIQASDGNLYGATTGTVGGSQLFRITTSGQYTLLKQMVLYYDGQCQCQLIQGSDGNIYGTAQTGGVNGSGVYFALDAGLPKPAPQAMQFHPESGAVGTRVLVWGSNLLASTVSFNGVPASAITNSGANYVWATVPAGASTGPLTVTTPGGSMTTQASFTVQ